MKKLTAILLVILMLIPLIVSCGGSDETTTTEILTTETPSTEMPTTEAPTTETPTTEAPTTEIPTTKPIVTYNIKYELNGGTNNANNPSSYNTGEIISLSFPTKEDYMFMGWYTDSELTSEIKEIADKTGDLTLYAKWVNCEDIFDFTNYENRYTIKINPDYNVDRIIIPSTYKNLPVTEIIPSYDNKEWTVKTVIIPDTVISISEYGIIAIESQRGLLEEIRVDQNNPNYKSIDGVLYSKGGKTLIHYPANKRDESYAILHGVTHININAFECSKNIKSIIIPNGVTSIGVSAFSKCENLESIVIPNTVTELGHNSFYLCTSLKNVTLSGSIDTIFHNTFYGCSSLESIVIPNGVKTIDQSAFKDCDSIKEVELPNSLTFLAMDSFANCSSLETIVIPKSTIKVNYLAFMDCPSLTVCFESEEAPEFWINDRGGNGADYVKEVIWGYKEE